MDNPLSISADSISDPSSAPSETAKIFPWEKLPFEIRDQIFAEVDYNLGGRPDWSTNSYYFDGSYYFEWNGSMPPLIVALRTLKLSYQHVMQWFSKHNSHLFLHEGSGFDITDMTNVELEGICSISVELADRSCRLTRLCTSNPGASEGEYGLEKPEWFTKPLLRATNLRKVDLYLEFYSSMHHKDVVSFIKEIPYWLEGSKGLSKLTLHVPVTPWAIHSNIHAKLVYGIFKRLMEKIGVQGKLVEKGDNMSDVWVWEALPGRLMNFAQDLKRQWRYPRKGLSLTLRRWDLFDDNGEHLKERDGRFVLEDWSDEYD